MGLWQATAQTVPSNSTRVHQERKRKRKQNFLSDLLPWKVVVKKIGNIHFLYYLFVATPTKIKTADSVHFHGIDYVGSEAQSTALVSTWLKG